MERKHELEHTKVDGLILNLFKRKLFQKKSDRTFYDYMLLGFYDGMVLLHPNTWLDFGPEGIESLLKRREEENESDLKSWDDFSGMYPLKLLFPREKYRENMRNGYGFDFSVWENNSATTEPLFAGLLLKVTDKFVRYSDKEIEINSEHRLSVVAKNLWTAISDVCSGDKRIINSLHCGLFQCIGYYDYALLFQCNNWNYVYRIANKLKSLKINKNGSVIPFVASDYLLLGMNSTEGMYQKIDNASICEMSIEVSMNPGHSVDEFYNAFIEQYRIREGGINSVGVDFWEGSSEYTRFYQLSGGADCIILTGAKDDLGNPGMKHVLREFDKDGLFTPSDKPNSFFNEYISHIQTSARRYLQYHSSNYTRVTKQKNENSTVDNVVEGINLWIKKAYTRWSGDSAFIRRIHGLQELMAQYENLIGNNAPNYNHTFDIMKVLTPAYLTLLNNLEALMTLWDSFTQDNQQCKVKENTLQTKNQIYENKFYQRKYQKRIYALLTDFREYVGTFQDALQLSNRHFIESVRISHPSVGSSTKILLVYNEILNQFVNEMGDQLAKIVRETLDDSGKHKRWISCEYCFLLTCGGQDQATVNNLSEDIPNAKQTNENCQIEQALIVMRLSERSIFDIRGSMFRMLHELWHYCGHRMRTVRCNMIIQDASYRFATAIANELIHKRAIIDIVEKSNLDYRLMSDIQKKNINSELVNIINTYIVDLTSKIEETICEKIRTRLNDEVKKEEKVNDFYYGKRIFDKLKDITIEEFIQDSYEEQSSSLDEPSDLWECIYNEYKSNQIKMYSEIKDMFENNQIDIQMISEIIWKLTLNQKHSVVDESIKCLIQSFLEYLAGDVFTPYDPERSYQIENDAHIALLNKHRYLSSYQDQWNYWFYDLRVEKVYDFLSYVYRETFSDNMACKTIGDALEKEEYIMSFIYTNDDIDYELEPVEKRALRMGTILEHHFGCENEELNLEFKVIKQLYLEMFGDYMDEKSDRLSRKIQAIICNMNKLWNVYRKSIPGTRNLIKYLKETENIHRLALNSPNLKSGKTIQKLYKKAKNMNSHDDVMDVMQELLSVWAEMAAV